MKTPKVLLLYTPLQFLAQETVRPDGSLGPLYLAGALEDAGIEVDVVDAVLGPKGEDLTTSYQNRELLPSGLTRIGMSYDRIAEMVARGGYNIVGIHSNFTPQTRMVLETAQAIKKVNPEILIVCGGVNARNIAPRLLGSGFIDIIATTEAEKIFVQLVRNWAAGYDPTQLNGFIFLKDGKLTTIPPKKESTSTDLDELPLPRWSKLPLDKYAQVAGPHGDVTAIGSEMYTSIMTSRGCPFRCTYCHIAVEKEFPDATGNIGALRLKSVDRVLDEMRILKDLGIKKLYFEDDSLFARKGRIISIFEKVIGMGFRIADVNGVNVVHLHKRNPKTGKLEPDREFMGLLKSAGFDSLVFPAESGSMRILTKYSSAKLNLETMNLVELVKAAVEAGITCPINMMIGFPDETEAEIMQTVELGKRLVDAGAYHCAFFIPIPFPGSTLFDYAVANGHMDADYDSDLFNIHRVVMKNTTVSPEKLIDIREHAWQTVNREEYVKARLKLSVGARIPQAAVEAHVPQPA